MFSTDPVGFGARAQEVDEPHLSLESSLFRSNVILQAEFDLIAEPKSLKSDQILELYQKFGTYRGTGHAIGVSEGFVRLNIKTLRRKK